jgi:dolichyl-phosphate-mannose--protein O-mannosyl transferase
MSESTPASQTDTLDVTPAAPEIPPSLEPGVAKEEEWTFWERNYVALLTLILVFTFGIRIYGLSTPSQFEFDEVYHAFTAQNLLIGNPNSYDPWAKPPPGVAYEWTHPPLGKLLMTMSMMVFGDNPFGWRFSSVLFGTVMVWLSALIARRVFGVEAALLTAYLLSVETMHFVMSRVAMVDVHVGFFVLAAVFLYLAWSREPARLSLLFGAGLGVGLATATKWNGGLLLPVFALDFLFRWLVKKDLPDRNWTIFSLVAFVFIPAVTYVIVYTQYFVLGFSLENLIELQRQMYWYHVNLRNSHPSQSEVWQWLLNLKPVYIDSRMAATGEEIRVFNLGNHVVLLCGLLGVARTVRELFVNFKNDRFLLVVAYFLLWLPWAGSPRVKYFHHYLTAVPFLCMMLADMLATRPLVRGSNGKEHRPYFVQNMVLGAGVWMLVLYPFVSGMPLRRAYMDLYMFLLPFPY